jgi:hypothetical protein
VKDLVFALRTVAATAEIRNVPISTWAIPGFARRTNTIVLLTAVNLYAGMMCASLERTPTSAHLTASILPVGMENANLARGLQSVQRTAELHAAMGSANRPSTGKTACSTVVTVEMEYAAALNWKQVVILTAIKPAETENAMEENRSRTALRIATHAPAARAEMGNARGTKLPRNALQIVRRLAVMGYVLFKNLHSVVLKIARIAAEMGYAARRI